MYLIPVEYDCLIHFLNVYDITDIAFIFTDFTCNNNNKFLQTWKSGDNK